MSHGDAGSRYNMQTVCEHLAAHGYIVVAPEHTGNSPYSFAGRDPALKDDRDFRRRNAAVLQLLDERGIYAHDEPYGQTYAPFRSDDTAVTPESLLKLDASLVERVNDLRAVLRHLEETNEKGFPSGRIDLQNVGLDENPDPEVAATTMGRPETVLLAAIEVHPARVGAYASVSAFFRPNRTLPSVLTAQARMLVFQ